MLSNELKAVGAFITALILGYIKTEIYNSILLDICSVISGFVGIFFVIQQMGCGIQIVPSSCQKVAYKPLANKIRLERLAIGIVTLMFAILMYTGIGMIERKDGKGSEWWMMAKGLAYCKSFLVAAPLWFSLSFIVAAITSYRGCPEIGAISSLLLSSRVATTCNPLSSNTHYE